jgi:hypothetical protein
MRGQYIANIYHDSNSGKFRSAGLFRPTGFGRLSETDYLRSTLHIRQSLDKGETRLTMQLLQQCRLLHVHGRAPSSWNRLHVGLN